MNIGAEGWMTADAAARGGYAFINESGT